MVNFIAIDIQDYMSVICIGTHCSSVSFIISFYHFMRVFR